MKICRACLEDTKSVLKPFIATDEIFELYNEFTSLNVYLSDGLPNYLCKKCIGSLKKFKEFKELCLNSHTELKVQIGKVEPPEATTLFVDPTEIKSEDEEIADDVPMVEINTMGESEAIDDIKCNIKLEPVIGQNSNSPTDDNQKNPLFIKVRKKKPTKFKTNPKAEYQKKHSYAYLCNECGRGFHYKERYDGHLREHEGKSAAVCEFCDGEYSEWSGLQKHMTLMHEDEMKYVCTECGKKFIYESGLIAHSSRHFGPRKHMCELCGRSFYDTYTLGKHKLSHTDETPFECDVCGKKFKSDPHLKAHQFRHMGIKRFSCEVCGKAFTTRPELKQHMRVHSDVKEFQCTTCNQCFRQKSQLSVHQRSHLFD